MQYAPVTQIGEGMLSLIFAVERNRTGEAGFTEVFEELNPADFTAVQRVKEDGRSASAGVAGFIIQPDKVFNGQHGDAFGGGIHALFPGGAAAFDGGVGGVKIDAQVSFGNIALRFNDIADIRAEENIAVVVITAMNSQRGVQFRQAQEFFADFGFAGFERAEPVIVEISGFVIFDFTCGGGFEDADRHRVGGIGDIGGDHGDLYIVFMKKVTEGREFFGGVGRFDMSAGADGQIQCVDAGLREQFSDGFQAEFLQVFAEQGDFPVIRQRHIILL